MASAIHPRAGGATLDPSAAKVLIVDDDERNAFAAVQALETLGYSLVVARSGEEALRRVLEEEFAVILLDLHMPGMDGYETAELLRSRRRSRETPIVFLTAVFRDEAHIFQAYSVGAIDVVFKPVDPFILRAKVSLLVDLHLKTEALRIEAENRLKLLAENARIYADKLAAERDLRLSRERQETILRSLPIVFHSRHAEPPYAPLFVSDSVLGLTGFPPERFTGEPGFGFSRIHADDVAIVERAHAQALQTGAYQCEYRWQAADGRYISLLDQGVFAPSEGGGRAIFGTLLDNTERRLLEEQLAHARKIEAIGQLTGGVAHDFNNLLTVVLGNVSLLSKSRLTERQRRQLESVRHATERGRSLTQQLLAYSRRQNLSPVVLDVGALISDFAPLLRQAVGEAVTLQLELHSEPLHANIDPAQLESALLNLAVNARDAMPGGGRLIISTRRIGARSAFAGDGSGAGDWLEIEVRDTGVGMSEDLRSRVFEPFFTTKDIGKGSGLGLSQVYGFVRQSGGQIHVESAPGQGSAFKLHLLLTAPGAEVRRAAPPPRAPVGGSERILAVEDDPAVLSLTLDMLKGLGYRVVAAPQAAQAMEALRADPSIDLLFSDVVMPGGVSGVQLAREARILRPDLQILLTSGFVGPEAPTLGEEFPLIDKPYEPHVLAARLRELLDARPSVEASEPQSLAAG